MTPSVDRANVAGDPAAVVAAAGKVDAARGLVARKAAALVAETDPQAKDGPPEDHSAAERLAILQLQKEQSLKLVQSFEHQFAVMSANCTHFRESMNQDLEALAQELTAMRLASQDLMHSLDSLRQDQVPRARAAKVLEMTPGRRPFGSPKVFVHRKSRISELLEFQDFRTIYNVFVAVLIVLLLNVFADSYSHDEKILDFSIFRSAFANFDKAAMIWGGMMAYAISSYIWCWVDPARYAGHGETPAAPWGNLRMWAWIVVYGLAQLTFAGVTSYWTLRFRLPMASGFAVMTEHMRLGMKVHSFFRAQLPFSPMPPPPTRAQSLPGFSHYVYFLFCPTLLYRDSYPRTPSIRPLRVLKSAAECCCIVLYLYVMFVGYSPQYKDLEEKRQRIIAQNQATLLTEIQFLAFSMLSAMLPGLMILVFGFFGLLHCWLNMWAELLRFGDRLFYQSWWNSVNFAQFYRSWNGVVYDWLYQYVYLEVVTVLERLKCSRSTAKFLGAIYVIEISAVLHEYVLSMALGHCSPFLLFFFGVPGLAFTYVNPSNSRSHGFNVWMWGMLLMGLGMLLVLYGRESFYRQRFVVKGHNMDESFLHEFFTVYTFRDLVGI